MNDDSVRGKFFKLRYGIPPGVSYHSDPQPKAPNLDLNELRFRHLYIPGKTGYGKSTLMHHLALKDIQKGRGVCVIDPKGDLVNQLIHWIPQERKDDCIYLDTSTPIPIDFMRHEGHQERESLVSDLKHLLLQGQGNAPRMEAIIIDLLYTLLAMKGTCFLDVYRFFRDPTRQKEIIRQLPHTEDGNELRARWDERNFPRPDESAPILSRMTKFVRNPTLRAIIGAPDARLNIEQAINDQKIILVNLGGLSEATLIYGGLIFAKIKQAIFARHHLAPHDRVPFYLYIDEFHKFQNPDTFEDVLTMARGYRLSLTLANPTLEHLDPRIKSSLGIISSYILFCLDPNDTRFFKAAAKPYDHEILAELHRFEAVYKLGDAPAERKPTPPPPRHTSAAGPASNAAVIRKRTIEKYACRAQEPEVIRQAGDDEPQPTGRPKGVPPYKGKTRGA
jgi:Helicase HerA, central domain